MEMEQPLTQNDRDREAKVGEFFRLDKFEKMMKPSWPKSDVEGWRLKVGSTHTVKIIGNVSDLDYPLAKLIAWIELKKQKRKLYAKMMNELQSLYSAVLDNPKALFRFGVNQEFRKGQFVVIWHPDVKRFTRAVLKRECSNTKDEYFALSMDFGRFVTVKKDQIYVMCDKFMELRPRAVFLYMDGIHHFSRSSTLKKIIRSLPSNGEVSFEHLCTFKVTRIEEQLRSHPKRITIFGNLFQKNPVIDVHLSLMQNYWTNASPPVLPKLNQDKILGHVVHAEKDGSIYLQFESSTLFILQEYCRAARQKLDGILNLQNEMELSKYKVFKPINEDPKKIYMVQYNYFSQAGGDGGGVLDSKSDVSDHYFNPTTQFCRVQVMPRKKKKNNPTNTGKFFKNEWTDLVRFNFIDCGFEKTLNISETIVVAASKLHPLLDKIPPQVLKARLANVKSMDVDQLFKKVLRRETPVIVRTVADPSADGKTPAQVQLYKTKVFQPGKHILINVADELIKEGIAQPVPITETIIQRPSKIQHSQQLEYIEMKGTTDWGDILTKQLVELNFSKNCTDSGLSCNAGFYKGEKIWFFLLDTVVVEKHLKYFVIQTVYARRQIEKYSDLISAHVGQDWTSTTVLRRLQKLSMQTGWFYSYLDVQKGFYVRARLLSGPRAVSNKNDGIGLEDENENEEAKVPVLVALTVKLLLIDYAEIVEVPVEDLLLSIPLSVCGIGPMAATVSRLRFDNSELLSLSLMSKDRRAGKMFRERFSGKKCTAIVKKVQYDEFGVANLQLERLKLAPLTL